MVAFRIPILKSSPAVNRYQPYDPQTYAGYTYSDQCEGSCEHGGDWECFTHNEVSREYVESQAGSSKYLFSLYNFR